MTITSVASDVFRVPTTAISPGSLQELCILNLLGTKAFEGEKFNRIVPWPLQQVCLRIEGQLKECQKSINDFFKIYNENPSLRHLMLDRKFVNLRQIIDYRENDGSTLLHKAAKEGNFELFKKLIEKGAILKKDYEGNTILHYAARGGSLILVEYIINTLHQDPDVVNSFDVSIFHEAAKSGNKDLVEYLINNYHLDPNIIDQYHRSILHYACKSGNLELVQYLINLNADISLHDVFGNTVLHYAAKSGNKDLLQHLFTLHAPGDIRVLHDAAESGNIELVDSLLNNHIHHLNPNGEPINNVLEFAVNSGNTALVKYLIDRGLDINLPGQLLLHTAAGRGNIQIVKLLLEHGLNPQMTDYWGNTVLHFAARSGNIELVDYLIGLGMNPNVEAVVGRYHITVLHEAVRSGNLELVKQLINSCHLDADLIRSFDKSLLSEAADAGNKDLVEYLITEFQLNPEAQDTYGSVLAHAIKSGNIALIKYLVEVQHVNLNARDLASTYSEPCLHIAAKYLDREMVQYLIEAGADPYALNYTGATLLQAAFGKQDLIEYLTPIFRANRARRTRRNICFLKVSLLAMSVFATAGAVIWQIFSRRNNHN